MDHQVSNRLFCFNMISSHDDAFPSRQSIRLDHYWRFRRTKLPASQMFNCLRRRFSHAIRSSRYLMSRHEILGEDLASLESRGSSSRTNNTQASFVKKINDPVSEQCFGSDKSQINLL